MFLKEKEKRLIIDAGFDLLESTGLRVLDSEALELFKKNSCQVSGEIVRVPRNIIEECIADAPSKWTIYDREGNEKLFMGEGNTYYGTADVAPHFLDHKTDKVRNFTLNDTETAAKLIEHLPNIDFASPFGSPQDVDQSLMSTKAFIATISNTAKPTAYITLDIENQELIIKIGSILKGGLENLQKEPFIFPLIEPISPLTYTNELSQKILRLAEKELPFFLNSCPALGATSPVTLAGALVQMLPEVLLGVALTQFKKKGAPIGIGASIGGFDMSVGNLIFGTPEHVLSNGAFIELVRYLKIPCWANGCSSHAKTVDQQAIIDSMFTCLVDNLAGSDVVWDAGYLETGKISSLEMLVIIDEVIGLVRRIKRGIEINDETLAIETIKNVGPGGNFINSEHTYNNFRKELWFPTIMDRQTYDGWVSQGKLTLRDRAKKKIDDILLSGENVTQLSPDIVSEINGLFAYKIK